MMTMLHQYTGVQLLRQRNEVGQHLQECIRWLGYVSEKLLKRVHAYNTRPMFAL